MGQDSETGCLHELNIKIGQLKFYPAFLHQDILCLHMNVISLYCLLH